MFYTILRGLMIFILWTLNGNAHYHNKENSFKKDERYILVCFEHGGIQFYGFCDQAKQFVFMAKRRLCNQDSAGWFACAGAFPIDEKIPVAYQYPVQYATKRNVAP